MNPSVGLIPWEWKVSEVNESLVHVMLEYFGHVGVDVEVVDEHLVHVLLSKDLEPLNHLDGKVFERKFEPYRQKKEN